MISPIDELVQQLEGLASYQQESATLVQTGLSIVKRQSVDQRPNVQPLLPSLRRAAQNTAVLMVGLLEAAEFVEGQSEGSG